MTGALQCLSVQLYETIKVPYIPGNLHHIFHYNSISQQSYCSMHSACSLGDLFSIQKVVIYEYRFHYNDSELEDRSPLYHRTVREHV